eukprot:TRINITY_DN114751_c0_g1_i1.p1 TRINITY_DN114751_c0_g1~~TRINITY_DN114751_c0_g1_i1.p1  ORF type:complete len:132 (-),score=25.51 TRINITY_DN114751_c0_g1_i1:61-429(-)
MPQSLDELAIVANGYWCATIGPLLLLRPPHLSLLLKPLPTTAIRPIGLITTLWGTLLLNEPFKDSIGRRETLSLACGANATVAAGLTALTAAAPVRILAAAGSVQVAAFAAWQYAAIAARDG